MCDNSNQSPFTPKAARLRRALRPVVAHRRVGVLKSATMKLPKVCGIYQFTHIPSGKCYIGSSNNLLSRISGHIRLLISSSGGSHFIREARRLGFKNFRVHVVEVCGEGDRFEREKIHIERVGSVHPSGFNISKEPTKIWDYVWTDEAKRKASASKIGHAQTGPKFQTAESREKMSKAHFERWKHFKFSNKVRRKLSLKMIGNKFWLGRKHSDESKRKISEAKLKTNTMAGKNHSPETILKISKAVKTSWIKRKLKHENYK